MNQKRQKKGDKRGSSKRGRGGGRGGRGGGRGRGRGGYSTKEKRPREEDVKTEKPEEKGKHIHFDDDGPPAAKQIKTDQNQN
ncbi:eukaryotic translation initiation factor 3 subunit F-like [Exaiptasia diaphana]|uniref:Uncharacterized protein n=1 Tax=Exaiptasia diaphana TaxID=2652724 RepID=A0A913WZG2_EXADI|nr:eukaryotic translation initiation factor 3 subunit F-like [Exaiptasia diaphana]